MPRRLTLVFVAVALSATELTAQGLRMPRIGRRGPSPERPAEKPPQAPGIPDALAYSRYRLSRFSLEQYPMLSYLSTTGFVAEGIPANYWVFGDGTHLGFRVAPSLSLTADVTSSVVGGPFSLGSAEFGFRVKPWASPRFTPFLDARTSWAYTMGSGAGSNAVPGIFLARSMFGDFTSGSGRGNVLGLGVETRIRPQWSLATTLSTTRYAMTGRNLQSRSEWKYTADATRLTVGVKYNHGRWLDPR